MPDYIENELGYRGEVMKRKYVEMKPWDDPTGVTMPKMASYRAIAQLLPFLCLWPHCASRER